MTAIITALRWVEETKPLISVICTDSMAVLQSFITDNAIREDLVLEVKHLLLNLLSLGIMVQFCWIPGIDGNEIADKLAKKALELDQVEIHNPFGKGDSKALIKSLIILRWQDEWESESNAIHYHRNQNSVGGKRITALGLNRHEEGIIPRLRLGHTGLNSTLSVVEVQYWRMLPMFYLDVRNLTN